MYNHTIGRTASVISLFYSLLPVTVPLKEIPEHFPFYCTQHPVHNTVVVVVAVVDDSLTFSAHLPVMVSDSVFFRVHG